MSLIVCGATIIAGTGESPIDGHSIWIEAGRIKAIGRRDELGAPSGTEVIDARGKFVIPGLMDANVHLLVDTRLENLTRYEGRYEELIAEAAQVALKNGVTTVFDSWGPRRALMSVRERINAGELAGSRIFCAGNIVGLNGPLSIDFWPKALDVASDALVKRINARWAENVGPELTWMTPEQVVTEVRTYVARGIDFLKYASSEHRIDPTAFLQFSPLVQTLVVEEAHRAGITAQAHSNSVEALRTAIEAGCDLVQHGNTTGPVLIPDTTLELFVTREAACAVLPWTKRRTDWLMKNASPAICSLIATASANAVNLIRSGAKLLLSTDGGIVAPDGYTDPGVIRTALWSDECDENLGKLGEGHVYWFRAMDENGMRPMDMLEAATRNIAVAYQKDKDLGTIEPGKIADLLILNKDPLLSPENYRSIHLILKEGVAVDRSALPSNPTLTKLANPRSEEGARDSRYAGAGQYPMCC